jgi:hypothetical protein
VKVVLLGNAQSKPAVIGLLTEDLLIDVNQANKTLSKYKLEIDHVDINGDQKIVYIKEQSNNNNLILG